MSKLSIPGLVLALLTAAPAAAQDGIAIRSDFPGGNVIVQKIEEDKVHVAPDLRGGRPWFYWCFEVSSTDRKLFFVFPDTKATPYFVGMQGPAISLDEGKTWDWLGSASATPTSFSMPLKRARRCDSR